MEAHSEISEFQCKRVKEIQKISSKEKEERQRALEELARRRREKIKEAKNVTFNSNKKRQSKQRALEELARRRKNIMTEK